MRTYIWWGIIAAVIVLSGTISYYLLRKNNTDTAAEMISERFRATIVGEYLCLPFIDALQDDGVCVPGLRTDDGTYYAIDFTLMSQIAQNKLESGMKIQANGVVTPIELLSTDHWRKYPIIAIFSVTDSVTILP